MTKTTHGWYLQSNSHQGLEQDSSKPIWSQTFSISSMQKAQKQHE